jgi:hypothetical protein
LNATRHTAARRATSLTLPHLERAEDAVAALAPRSPP